MQEPGPFEHAVQTETSPSRDRAAAIIVAAGIVLGLFMLILVLPPISILDNGGGNSVSGPVTATARDEMPPVPAGYEAVSALYDLTSQEPVDRPATVGVQLTSQQSANEELFLYTYQGKEWHQVGKAAAVAQGSAASGDVNPLPSNVAVFRKGTATRSVMGSLPVNGELDQSTLSALTTLNPQGYTANGDGSIGGSLPALPDNLSVSLVPTLSAPDAETLTNILSSEESRAAHIDAIVTLVNDNDYAGIDLDYRVMAAEDGDDFVALVTALSEQLRQANRTLTLTLPAPVKQGNDWNTRGFDWDRLAPLVDTVKVAPEGDPGTYYTVLNDALGYLVPRVGSSKLFVTLDSLSREQSSEGVRSLTLTDALTLASTPAVQGDTSVGSGASVSAYGQNLSDQSGGSVLHWDDAAKAVTFTYTGGGGQRGVWLANAFSESFKLDLARRYQLGGIAIEDVSTGAGDANVTAAVSQYKSSGNVQLVKPNGQLLQPHWTASGGTLQSDTGANVTWQAPDAAGDYTLTLIVSDGTLRLGQELRLSVGS
jgi:hypothetical protein